jgi:hypothetical protein
MSKKPGKSSAKKKAAAPPRAKSKAKAKTKAKAAAKPAARNPKTAKPASAKVTKPAARDALDDFIDSAARVLDLPIEPAWRGAIKANLAVTLRMGALVAEFALPDDAEPAPVFGA